jgi:(1->4)-alpha-D-glucan 1-alpha-D-glucosylmutase
MRDELTGREFRGRVPVASVFERYPVALLAVIR